jgi:hypothetical protein
VRSGSQFRKIRPWPSGSLSIWEVWDDSAEGSSNMVSPIETLNHYSRSYLGTAFSMRDCPFRVPIGHAQRPFGGSGSAADGARWPAAKPLRGVIHCRGQPYVRSCRCECASPNAFSAILGSCGAFRVAIPQDSAPSHHSRSGVDRGGGGRDLHMERPRVRAIRVQDDPVDDPLWVKERRSTGVLGLRRCRWRPGCPPFSTEERWSAFPTRSRDRRPARAHRRRPRTWRRAGHGRVDRGTARCLLAGDRGGRLLESALRLAREQAVAVPERMDVARARAAPPPADNGSSTNPL